MASGSTAPQVDQGTSPEPSSVQHPPTSQMVNNAITNLNEKRGSSVQAIKKYLTDHYKVDLKKSNVYINKYLKSAVDSGVLIQTSGTGALGSFKMASTGPIKKKVKKIASPKKAPVIAKTVKPKKSLSKKSLPRLSVGKKTLKLPKNTTSQKKKGSGSIKSSTLQKSSAPVAAQESPIKPKLQLKAQAKVVAKAASEGENKPKSKTKLKTAKANKKK